jgi:hypothetical protein
MRSAYVLPNTIGFTNASRIDLLGRLRFISVKIESSWRPYYEKSH